MFHMYFHLSFHKPFLKMVFIIVWSGVERTKVRRTPAPNWGSNWAKEVRGFFQRQTVSAWLKKKLIQLFVILDFREGQWRWECKIFANLSSEEQTEHLGPLPADGCENVRSEACQVPGFLQA